MLTSCFQASLVPSEIFIDTQQSSSWNTANRVFPFSKRNVNCSHKLYLLLSFTHNKHINSNLYKQEATICKLSTICWITFFKQTLCNLLCEPWYCPIRINCTFSLLPLIPWSMVWELVACNSLNILLLKIKSSYFVLTQCLPDSLERNLINCKGSFGKSISVTLALCIPTHCTPCLKTSLYFPLFSSEPIRQNASTVV